MPRISTWAFPMRDEWIVVIQSLSHAWFYDPVDCSTPGFPGLYYLPEFVQTPSIESVMPSNISSPVAPFSSCIQFFPASGSFPMSWLFTSGGQSIGASASALFLPMNIQGWFPLRWQVWSSYCPRDSQESSPAPQFESINSSALSLF